MTYARPLTGEDRQLCAELSGLACIGGTCDRETQCKRHARVESVVRRYRRLQRRFYR